MVNPPKNANRELALELKIMERKRFKKSMIAVMSKNNNPLRNKSTLSVLFSSLQIFISMKYNDFSVSLLKKFVSFGKPEPDSLKHLEFVNEITDSVLFSGDFPEIRQFPILQ